MLGRHAMAYPTQSYFGLKNRIMLHIIRNFWGTLFQVTFIAAYASKDIGILKHLGKKTDI